MSEVLRLQLIERAPDLVEARAIGYAHATAPLTVGLDEVAGLLADGAYARLGQALYAALFPEGPVRDVLFQALAATQPERRPLVVQLQLDAASARLARLPWELIHDGQSFLVADGVLALARFVAGAPALVPAELQTPLRVLLIAPRPVDLAACDGRPGSVILAALEPLAKQGCLHLDILSPPTYAALRDLLSREVYHILHFDGAAAADDTQIHLIFEDEHAASAPVSGATLHSALFLSQVRLAVLTALPPALTPLAGLAPSLVRAGIPAVVAMQYALEAEQYERFAAQLYHSLSEMVPLATAVAHARGQLLPPAATRFAPALYVQDSEGSGQLFSGTAQKSRPQPIQWVPAKPGTIAGSYRPEPIFVDRAHAVSHTLQALRNKRLVCLWGLGGVGKTAVAREVVRRGAWRFPVGITWLSLQGGRSLAAILADIAQTVELPKLAPHLEEASRQVLVALGRRLEEHAGEMLLVLDNYEDVAGNADLHAFLQELPKGVRILATSRSEPPVEQWHNIELRAMVAADIERILRHKLQAAGLAIAASDDPLIGEIASLLDGYPLGVDLVVSLARSCSLSHIRDELRAQPPPPLQAILRTTVGEALNDRDRALAARLAVLRAPFEQGAIGRLAGGGQWLPHIQRLRELALISFDGTHYAFDVPVREYLYSLLDADEARSCHEQAYRYFAGRRDLDGLVEAYRHALAAGEHQAARLLLRDRLIDPMLNAGRYHQLLALLEDAIATPTAFDERFLLARASIQRTLGRLTEALQSLQQLLQVPDLAMPSRALALHEQGRIYYELDDEEQGDHEQALDLYAQALAILDDLAATGNLERNRRRWLDAELASLLQDVAIAYQYALAGADDLRFARQLYSLSAGFWQRLRDPVSRAISEKQRAEILRTGSAEDRTEAKRIYRQVMQTFKRKGLERAYGDVLLHLGKIYQDEHGYKNALRRYQEYEEIQRRLGLEREEAMAWKQQGEIHQEAGYRGRSVRKAVELYSQALQRLASYGDRWSRRTVIATLLRRGEAYLELGETIKATEDFEAALRQSIAMGTRGDEFDVRRLSEDDRRRLLWACCAANRTAVDTSEGMPCEEASEAIVATAHSLGVELGPATCAALDCSQALDLPGWVRHHGAKRQASNVKRQA